MSAQMYRGWQESMPCKPFPFTYQGQGVTIRRTWADVREDTQRDGQSAVLHRSTSHIAPTTSQSERIKAEIRRESPRSPRNERPFTAASSQAAGDNVSEQGGSTTNSPNREASSMSLPRILPAPPRTPRQLVEAGRIEYLALKRREPVEVGKLTALSPGYTTVNQTYGGSLGAARALRAGENPCQFHRKAPGLKDAYRPCGVF